jgi:hypothetical protein
MNPLKPTQRITRFTENKSYVQRQILKKQMNVLKFDIPGTSRNGDNYTGKRWS